jgi:uncharacterized protein
MTRERLVLPIAALVSLFAGFWSGRVLAAAAPVPAKPDRYVTDLAKVLPEGGAASLNEKLAAFERETSAQVLVYVVPKVPEGTTPEELGAAAIREWGVGQKGRSNGVVFFVFPEDRKMRIAVGYGLEGALPDATTKRILADVVKPLFLKGDSAGGIEAGVDAILAAARGEGQKGTGRTVAEAGGRPARVWVVLGWMTWAVAGTVLLLAFYRRSVAVAILGCFVGFAALFIPIFAFNVEELLFPGLFLVLISVVAVFVAAARQTPGASTGGRRSGRGDGGSSSNWSSGSSSSTDSSSSSSSDSSSSFSGGGGDSGGGGSSESW